MNIFIKMHSSSIILASWPKLAIFWAVVTVLLLVEFVTQNNISQFTYATLYFFWLELFFTGCKWCFVEENWPSFISAAWLLACTLGVWLPFQRVNPSSINFVCLLLAGYSTLRFGMLCAIGMPPLHRQAEKICKILSPEHLAPHTYKYTIYSLGIGSALALSGIYLWFCSIPILSANPELARYQYFNGPFTNNLFRFSFRAFSSLSLISSLYIIAQFNAHMKKIEIGLASLCVVLSSLCMIASGNRGDISALFLFLMIRIFFSLSKKRKTLGGIIISATTLSIFCFLTRYRNIDNILSRNTVFPEVTDAAKLLDAVHVHHVAFAHGNTYLAAALSFIPSSIFPFRETWGFGRYALHILFMGQDTPIAQSYGGLRPTFVGEAWLNGGWLGVVAFGVALGIILGTWHCSSQSLKRLPGAKVIFFLLSLCSVMVSDFYGVFHDS
jgi:hypothetical protein